MRDLAGRAPRPPKLFGVAFAWASAVLGYALVAFACTLLLRLTGAIGRNFSGTMVAYDFESSLIGGLVLGTLSLPFLAVETRRATLFGLVTLAALALVCCVILYWFEFVKYPGNSSLGAFVETAAAIVAIATGGLCAGAGISKLLRATRWGTRVDG
ncbi:MAG: hypothetical protein ACYC96_11600 [Fimbriimonadaceae bacterium]